MKWERLGNESERCFLVPGREYIHTYSQLWNPGKREVSNWRKGRGTLHAAAAPPHLRLPKMNGQDSGPSQKLAMAERVRLIDIRNE
jgi:hypothetical protein